MPANPVVVQTRNGAHLHYLRRFVPGSSTVRTLCGVGMGRALARYYAGAVGRVNNWPTCASCARIYRTMYLRGELKVTQQGEL